jgi:hypothetical protein
MLQQYIRSSFPHTYSDAIVVLAIPEDIARGPPYVAVRTPTSPSIQLQYCRTHICSMSSFNFCTTSYDAIGYYMFVRFDITYHVIRVVAYGTAAGLELGLLVLGDAL